MDGELSASLASVPEALLRRHCHRMILRYHDVFGQWHVENLRAYVPHERGYFVVKTNREGMRHSRDVSAATPSGRVRILVFGDSFTAGEGVHNEERFTDLLEGMLDGSEVLNFGLDGSGTDQQVLIFERLGSRFDRDVLLFCPMVENIRRVVCRYWPAVDRASGRTVLVPKPYFILQGNALELRHVPVPRERPVVGEQSRRRRLGWGAFSNSSTLRTLFALAGPIGPLARKVSGYQPFPQYDRVDSLEWRLTEALFERVIEQAGSCPVIIAPLPMFYHMEGICPANYLARYRALARAHPEVHLIDVLPYFERLSPAMKRSCRYPNDVHYTPLGHAVVAGALREELSRLGLVQLPARRADGAVLAAHVNGAEPVASSDASIGSRLER